MIITGENVMKQNTKYNNNLNGEWKIKAYISPDYKVLINCNIIFNKGKFMIKGEHLFQLPYEKELMPHIVDQNGTFEIKNDSIKIINENYLDGEWYFYGDFKLIIFDNKNKFQEEIQKIPNITYYYQLKKKDKSVYALFT